MALEIYFLGIILCFLYLFQDSCRNRRPWKDMPVNIVCSGFWPMIILIMMLTWYDS